MRSAVLLMAYAVNFDIYCDKYFKCDEVVKTN